MNVRLLLFLFLMAASVHAAEKEDLQRLGVKFSESGGQIVQAQAKCDAFTEPDFRALGSLTSLKKLTLSGRTITDAALPLLAGLSELEELSTDGIQLTDEGYRHFAAFPKLRSLALFHPAFGSADFTGSGLAHLKALPKLEKLTFAGSTAGDAALEAIGQLTQLQEFRTWHTAQTQAGNLHLLKLTQLKALRIGQRLPVRGAPSPASFDLSTFETLAQMKSLERLEVTEARLNSGIIPQLQSLPRLTQLKIQTVDILESEVEAIRKALPQVKIDFTPLSEADKEATLAKKLRL